MIFVFSFVSSWFRHASIDEREGTYRRAGGAAEFQRDADETEFAMAGRGELVEREVFDDVDAVRDEQVRVAEEHHSRLGILLGHAVPCHVVGADRPEAPLGGPQISRL